MHEMIPVALGAVVAWGCSRITPPWVRRSVFAALILVAAALASVINGEPLGSSLFIVADVCFALAGAVAARLILAPLWRARALRLAAGRR